MVSIKSPLFLLAFIITAGVRSRTNDFETPDFLRKSAKDQLKAASKVERKTGIAKNLVLAVGDGMGISTLTAARIYIGQKKGGTGEEYKLELEKFPALGLSKTYNLDRQVPDSAGTAVAMMSGIKVNMGTLGVDGHVPYGKSCSNMTQDTYLKTVLDYALEEGKSVGIVTNTRITHATPAASYAHVPSRDLEDDVKMKSAVGCDDVKDIAYQLIMENPNINVILGGGRRAFLNKTNKDSLNRRREDGLDLIEEWKKDKANRGLRHQYVQNKKELIAADTDYLFGLFSSSHMEYEIKRNKTDEGQPSLAEMATKALQILKRNPNGFFLLIEGGKIDHGHHQNQGILALSETEMFDTTIKTIVDATSDDDTLITVTADHSHVFTIGGYPSRGNDILGTADFSFGWNKPEDGMPFTTLGYANGPSGRINGSRVDYTVVDTTAQDFKQAADVKMSHESHGGEDVAIYAKGPMSHLFHTSHEQSYIAHVMMYAACIGDYKHDCDRMDRRGKANAAMRHEPFILLLLCILTFIKCMV